MIKPHPERLERFFESLVPQPERHARWLNTVSMLEATGARKIWKSQGKDGLNEQILRHAVEESRHALFFKRAAQRVQPGSCEGYDDHELLEGRAARHYFQSLDYGIYERLLDAMPESKAKPLAYLYVTLAIEVRAQTLYPIYHKVLRRHRIPVTLRGIIEEEDQHLAEMIEGIEALDPDAEARRVEFEAFEMDLFEDFFIQLNAQAEAA